ncbi:MAG: hypothetical protein K9M02_01515 [Thiohalocapsa sp.]|nr:hypothetical protein [Thiohalocapsa sp.]
MESNSVYWNVEITGDREKLELLGLVLNSDELEIVRVDDGFVLRSSRFAPQAPAEQIDHQAVEIVKVLNGAAKLALGGSPEIKLTGLHRVREHGFDEHFAPSRSQQNLSDFVWSRIYKRERPHADRSEPAQPIPTWLLLGLGDDAVRTVFEILGTGPLGWQDIEILMSIVEADLKGRGTAEHTTCMNDARQRIARRRIAGATTRQDAPAGPHGGDRQTPGSADAEDSSSLFLSEARVMVDLLLHRWLAQKTGAAA